MVDIDITLEPPAQIEVEIAGQQCIAGLSAYQIAVKHGYTGSEKEWVLQFISNEKLKERISELEQQLTEIKTYIGIDDVDLLLQLNTTTKQGETL